MISLCLFLCDHFSAKIMEAFGKGYEPTAVKHTGGRIFDELLMVGWNGGNAVGLLRLCFEGRLVINLCLTGWSCSSFFTSIFKVY